MQIFWDTLYILAFGIILTFFQAIWRVCMSSKKNVLGSTYIVEQPSFSMLHSTLSFEFDLILGLFLTFWGHNGLLLGQEGLKKFLGSSHVV